MQLTRASEGAWKQVAAVCEDAAVFLDAGAAEHLHWVGGLSLLGGCVGAYDLYVELGPVPRGFIAAVNMYNYNSVQCMVQGMEWAHVGGSVKN